MQDKNKQDIQLPSLNLNVSVPTEQKESELIKTEQLIANFNEVFDDIRNDRSEIDEVSHIFLEMMMNEGDASSSTKEALVNLLKLKSETADRKTKLLDLLTRAFLKEKDTFPKYLAAHQHNDIRIEGNKKANLLKTIQEEKNGNK